MTIAEILARMPAADAWTPRQIAAAMPGRPHLYSVLRWIRRGVRVAGRTVHLPATRIGGRWFVSPRDLTDFLAATQPDADDPPAERRPTPAARRGAHQRALAELRREGLMTTA